jgi:hypothetical protein
LDLIALLGVLTLSIVAGVTGLIAVSLARAKRELPTVRGTPIRDFPDRSQGVVVGKIRCVDGPVVSPLTGRSCAFYDILVERKADETSEGWWEVLRDTGGTDLWLEDDTGCALVQVAHATTDIERDVQLSSGNYQPATEQQHAFLARHGESTEALVMNKVLRYWEGVIVDGERIAVRGYGSWEPDPDPADAPEGYREIATRLVIGSASAEHPLRLSRVRRA